MNAADERLICDEQLIPKTSILIAY